MDIAKYIVTALILSSAFGEMDAPWIWWIAGFAGITTLICGLWLIRKNGKEE